MVFIDAFIVVAVFLGILLAIGCVGLLLVREVRASCGDLLRRIGRSPQFGISALFTLVTIFAAACALFRWFVDGEPPAPATLPGTLIVGVIALVWATGIVLALQFLLVDLRDNWIRRKRCANSHTHDVSAFNAPAPESAAERESNGTAIVSDPEPLVPSP
ncbi:MAG TPA: hypothetical protein VJ783_27930 [Pirellulales bacterium]|nr:hypothetical protein [Pirellulales bacterium]